jgi:hypothetical protein
MTKIDDVSRIKRGIERILVAKGASRKDARGRVNRISAQNPKTPENERKSDE